ncbi:hypothetical protein BDV95DRAFT_503555 [Massariosphaeria phaeospora]|uniref:Uncharacterized protein n=1 Tax=Massariosphaeria phaeospora TaxID=100035 RepID=A0A7C8I1M8_9PLEO|nr:hypothetical protein BDV95DRAFT_503555 [Massariosphaeria phaeospora]
MTPKTFFDLPLEIRTQIYNILLCDFPDVCGIPDHVSCNAVRAPNSIETSILRTSKQVHGEAYDAMIKNNLFILLESDGTFPLERMLYERGIPVVAKNVPNFEGYVLSVSISRKISAGKQEGSIDINPCTFMCLLSHMRPTCGGLADCHMKEPGFNKDVEVRLTVGPIKLASQPLPFKYSIADFFTQKTQETLLYPFRTGMRGFPNVIVQGLVSPALATAIREEMAQERWEELCKVIYVAIEHRNVGSRLYQQRDRKAAIREWSKVTETIETLHRGASWPLFVERGGEWFVDKLLHIYLYTKLNTALVHTLVLEPDTENYMSRLRAFVRNSKKCTELAMSKGYWMSNYTWRPSIHWLADIYRKLATLIRLTDDRVYAREALTMLECAQTILPWELSIERQKQDILAWIDRIRREVGESATTTNASVMTWTADARHRYLQFLFGVRG